MQALIQGNPADTLQLPTDAGSFRTYLSVIDEWYIHHWHFILFAIGLAFAIYAVLTIADRLAEKWVAAHENNDSYISVSLRVVARTTGFFRLMLALELVDDIANAPGRVAHLIHVVFGIALVLQMAIWIRELIIGLIERMTHIGNAGSETLETAIVLIRILSSIIIYTIAGIMILDRLGLNVTGLVAGLGIGGIAIGLAAKNVFEELFSALSIIFDEPFKRGDKIRFDSTTAKVERVGIKSTRLRSNTGEQLIISNTNLLGKQIANLNRTTGDMRVNMPLHLIRQTPTAKLRALSDQLKSLVEQHRCTFIRAGFVGLGNSSLDYALVYDIPNALSAEEFQIKNDLGLAILELLEAQAISLSYPTSVSLSAGPDGIPV